MKRAGTISDRKKSHTVAKVCSHIDKDDAHLKKALID
jgi:hypothetical protein